MGTGLQPSILVTQQFAVSLGEQPGVVIGARDLERLIERLGGCKPGGWGELWLAGIGAGVAVTASAAVGALTLPTTLATLAGILWAATVAAILITILCLVGYLTQRSNLAKEITELTKDLEIHKPKVGVAD
jgi:hypothetical protein